MDGAEEIDSFKFDDDLFFNKNVEAVADGDLVVFVGDGKFNLAF